MILNSKGHVMLFHYIRLEFLLKMLENRAFSLGRQDRQSDPNDGSLPQANFVDPQVGLLERNLGVTRSLLRSQAKALHLRRPQTYIMSWSTGMSDERHKQYSEDGIRWKLETSQQNLKRILGFEQRGQSSFPPTPRHINGLRIGPAQLKLPNYRKDDQAISVVPAYCATACKDGSFYDEGELRIEAQICDGNINTSNLPDRVPWGFGDLTGVSIRQGIEGTGDEVNTIKEFADPLGFKLILR